MLEHLALSGEIGVSLVEAGEFPLNGVDNDTQLF